MNLIFPKLYMHTARCSKSFLCSTINVTRHSTVVGQHVASSLVLHHKLAKLLAQQIRENCFIEFSFISYRNNTVSSGTWEVAIY